MADAFDRSEREQITTIFNYIRANGLATAINRGEFEAVARGYNGSGQVDVYAGLMRAASQSYARVTAGKRDVIR